MGRSLGNGKWERKAQDFDSSSVPPDPPAPTPRGRTAEEDRQGPRRSRPPPLHARPRPPPPLHSWGRGGPGGCVGVDAKQMAGQAGPRPGGGARSGEGSARLEIQARKPRAAPSQPLVWGDGRAPRTRPPRALWPRAPRRGPARSPEAASPASSPCGTSPHAPRHPHTPAPCPSSEMSVTSPWPLTGRPGPPTPMPNTSILSSDLRPPRKVLGPPPFCRACPLPVPHWLPQPAPRGAPVSAPGSSTSSRPQSTSLSFQFPLLIQSERRLLGAHLYHHPSPTRSF